MSGITNYGNGFNYNRYPNNGPSGANGSSGVTTMLYAPKPPSLPDIDPNTGIPKSGTSGTSGASGASGASGTSGTSGTSGILGVSGLTIEEVQAISARYDSTIWRLEEEIVGLNSTIEIEKGDPKRVAELQEQLQQKERYLEYMRKEKQKLWDSYNQTH